MDGGLITTVVLLILFPGFVALKIIEGMTDPKSRSDFDKLGIALGSCLGIYLTYLGLSYVFKLPHIPIRYEPNGIWPFHVDIPAVALIAFLAIAAGFVVGRSIDRGWMERLNRNQWITRRRLGGPTSEWVRAFDENEGRYAYVRFTNGRALLGAISWHSDDPSHREFFLGREYAEGDNILRANVRMIEQNGDEAELNGPGVLVTHDADIEFIAFLDPSNDVE